jgi:hypothetical protein
MFKTMKEIEEIISVIDSKTSKRLRKLMLESEKETLNRIRSKVSYYSAIDDVIQYEVIRINQELYNLK